ncbi:MarR family winged helix-turn-helix transcriptional regulator [Streptomyces sp. NPDC127092]|uniref:MarR family winged helix-turn-helix transcriptional regulator n=1 Tax=Streptomyces sp. NPDC127092 TaxID=3347135 RepID=UPI003661FF43
MRLPIDQRLGHHLKRVEQELSAAKHSCLRPFKLNVPQYSVLLTLSHEPGLSGAVLARRCMVTPQTMSSVLATLEGRGLVERKPHPVHSHILEARLTRTGQNLLAKADEAVTEVELRLTEEFTQAEAQGLITSLERCSSALAGAASPSGRKSSAR